MGTVAILAQGPRSGRPRFTALFPSFFFEMGKVHGSLARAGKVKNQTPKVAKQEKKKKLTGRAKKRMVYNRRFVSVVKGGPKRGPNSNNKRRPFISVATPCVQTVHRF